VATKRLPTSAAATMSARRRFPDSRPDHGATASFDLTGNNRRCGDCPFNFGKA
jgi:hypothetical protein